MNEMKKYNVRKAIPMIMTVFISSATMISVYNIIGPQLTVDFDISASMVSLLTMIPMLILGIASVVYSTLSDYISIKKLMFAGIILMNAGALLSFLVGSQNFYVLMFSTAIMIGGGSCGSGLFIIAVTRYLPEEEHAKYYGLNSTCVNTAFALGILAGGFFATYLGWKFLFVLPFISLFTLPSLMKNLPDEPAEKSGRLDIVGLGLLTLLTLLISVCLNFGSSIYLAASVVVIALFFLYIAKCKNAFISLKFFKNRNYIIAVLLVSVALGIQSAYSFLFSFMAQTIHEIALDRVSLIILPSYIIAAFMGMRSGGIVERLGAVKTLFVDIIFLMGTLILCVFTLDTTALMLSICCCLFAGGCALLYAPFMKMVVSTLKPSEIGVGIGFFNLMTGIGPSLLIVLTGKMMSMEIMKHSFGIVSRESSLYANILGAFVLLLLTVLVVLFLTKKQYEIKAEDI